MPIEQVREYFKERQMEERILLFEGSSATVDLAAKELLVIPARIAKTLSFKKDSGCILVVTAGDMMIDNIKFKEAFSMKAKMLSPEEVLNKVRHPVGGVCPFALPRDVEVYLDVSLKRFQTVFPACGSQNSAIEMTCEELQRYAHAVDWVDVCKG